MDMFIWIELFTGIRRRRKMENCIGRILLLKDMTQAELARSVGVKREYMNRIINRRITPTVPLGLKIAKALGSSVEKVFSEGI